MITKRGSLLLFRLFRVDVFVNWTWLLGVAFMVYWAHSSGSFASGHSATIPYSIALYLSLFCIVLIHEFGHALACKSVGGRADQIVLWPLGGVAFVQPPQRPGAFLWSIAAGPLVNVVLLPLTIVPAIICNQIAAPGSMGADFFVDLAYVNATLLIFNMLPFYPLDGGQIVRSLVWFVAGPGLSLVIASILGLVGAVLLGLLALFLAGPWLGVMVFFMGWLSLRSVRSGWALYRLEQTPRRAEAACPKCGQHPPHAPVWRCPCGMAFDTFQTGAVCPACQRNLPATQCPFCQESSPLALWYPQGGESSSPVTVTQVHAPSTSAP